MMNNNRNTGTLNWNTAIMNDSKMKDVSDCIELIIKWNIIDCYPGLTQNMTKVILT